MSADTNSPIVIVGMACRVPGADSVDAFADLLFNSRTGYTELPADRCDRSLYFDPQKGKTGTSYTTLGGIVPERPLDRSLCPLPVETERLFDAVHVQFAEVAATAWQNSELVPKDQRLKCTGIYVGHSGGTKSEGGLSLATQIEEALSFVDDLEAFRKLPVKAQKEILSDVAQAIRETRPSRHVDAIPRFHAYQAAALAASILGLTGPRSVIDAACASSLVALSQAMMAIRTGRIDSAIVGGATYNNIDNLILFSHSQACTATDSRPFDDSASGLVSSEGYVAIVITTQSLARQHDLPILGVICGVGTASDGKGRSLWAPRMEGQMLALQRAYSGAVLLDIDYMEAHATSTQLGDATELETLRNLANSSPAFSKGRVSANRLLLGSVKSNIGHTLEAAGLISLVKVLIAMQRRQIPPSLRFEQPNHNYDWTTAPVRVVTRTEPWPEQSLHLRPRRAAVSAFGIGGLNTHVVVEEACDGVVASGGADVNSEPQTRLASQTSGFSFPLSTEPIVIVGRGLVVAGAKSLTEFKAILDSSSSAISDAPADRWRQRAGVSASTGPQPHRTPHCRGGFIRDFTFDGARYRIPPKQVQQSNPVQMMLIDAVAQALDDVNTVDTCRAGDVHPLIDRAEGENQGTYVPRSRVNFPFDRQRVGVVIGAIFGGEFGDQLQVGMRLPEICGQMSAAMLRRGLPPQLTQQVAAEFRQTVLKNRPALLDETGSFTASTLASRVAKTFDLMGGACSLDSDDASGLAALAVATDQLRAGICDMIVCGTAQRSMSLSAFESLDMDHRLVRSGRPEDVPENCQRIIPGEGVVALMLCRLSDAKRLDLPIYGILGDVTQRSESAERPSEVMNSADALIIRKIGYLCGGHSLVRIAAETLKTTGESEPTTIAARSSDGIVLQTQFVNPNPPRKTLPDVKPITSSPLKPQISPTMTTANAIATSDRPLRRFRFAATSSDSLLRLCRDSIRRTDELIADRDGRIQRDNDRSAPASSHFVAEDQFRSTILASSADQLRERLAAAMKSVKAGKFSTLLDRECVILWQAQEETSRVAWLFPGQGTHYPETPSVFLSSEHARRTLATVDDLYAASKLPRLSSVFGNAAIKPGEDVWWAQAWVLGVSASLIDALKAEGLRPDAVLGHSFGEFTASLAANVTTLPQSIELAKHRANAVMSHMRVPGGLLSIRAAVHEVDAILKPAGLTVYVTHLNSTRQTVIAGSREGIAAAKALLDQRGLPSISISVPAPFHTPLLAAAEVAFERMSASVPMRPPVCGFLSATSVQYLAEPCSIRNSLVRQLTQPVMYMPSIQRMLGEGFRVLLEVGPNDVLTRMNRDIVDSQAICLSLDVPGQPFEERMQLVHAVLECVANVNAPQSSASPGPQPSSAPIELVSSSVSTAAAPAVFDVTRTRRATRKSITPSTEPAVMPAVLDTEAALNGRSVHLTELPPRGIQPALQPVSSSKTAPAISDAQLRTFTRDLVVELTGYAPEIVDFEADLEADLGIDSIKKAQILGELGEWLGLTVRPESLRLDSVRTLDDAVRVAQSLAASNVKETGPVHQYTSSAIIASPEFSMAVSDQSNSHANRHAEHRGTLPPDDQLDALLIDYVVDQTGYSRDIVDVDADLEADLGLDSIKLAQLIGEMREQFNLESLTLESIGHARFRTLRGIREFLVRHANSADTPGSNNLASRAASASGYDDRNENRIATPVSTPLVAEHSFVGLRVKEIRGTDPISEISPEWLTPSNGPLQSAEAAGQGGARLGEKYRTEIRAMLRSLVHQPVAAPIAKHDWNAFESAHLKGVAAGAGVAESSVRFAAAIVRNRQNPAFTKAADTAVESTTHGLTNDIVTETSSRDQTRRYALKVVPAPRRAGMPLSPELHGAALILGSNALAESLADRIRQLGRSAIVLSTSATIAAIEKTLSDIWRHTATPHLFLTMAFDHDSMKSLTEADWQHRRPAALEAPFRICQLWMQRTIDANQMENASVVAVTQLGGDYGFSGGNVRSIEAIGGLVKAMLIEAWMRGFRTTPMKVIDVASSMSPQEVSSGVLQELAVPSYDMEIAFRSSSRGTEPERFCVQAVPAPLNRSAPTKSITRGGTWIVSGGGRGITAVVATTLAGKYDLKLHLLGTAPVPHLSNEFVRQVSHDRSGVRRQIMQDASARGENPVEAWRNTEKAIEVDATLRECRKQGIFAKYYCCDVAEFPDVENTIRSIRQQAGPIHGVIHGAGAGQDARFDRKRPDKVEKCLRAKIDGSLALMQATDSDPLEWFVTFGSISGRFGANGHTDYSLANDMMAKIVDRYRGQRPAVRSLTFHWHAWGDIGMATKPEARLALEMIDMEFMPAAEGIAHFIRELEIGGNEPEVLITDESYFRKFFPADRVSSTDAAAGNVSRPLLPSGVTEHADEVCSSVVTLNPVSDRFLSQHRVRGRATLPFVVALELMAEAVRARTGSPEAGICTQAQALQAIRFSTDDPLAVTVQTRPTADGKIECRLLADVRRRDGRMIEEDREFFRAIFETPADALHRSTSAAAFQLPANSVWQRITYATPEDLMYHGPELQELREIADDGQTIFGRIAASAPVQLFGGSRAKGFTVPCSTMDACLCAVGYAAFHRHQMSSLPVRFDQIEFGRLPDPGEPCIVRIRQSHISDTGAVWDFQLQGHNGDRLLTVHGYRTAWLKAGS